MRATSFTLEPLLYWLHERGEGRFSQFAEAVAAAGLSVRPYALARGLAEHALVEFDWDGDKRWSVTPATAVIRNCTGGRLTLWGGTHRTADALVNDGVPMLVMDRRIILNDTTFTYRHGFMMKPEKLDVIRQRAGIMNTRDVMAVLPRVQALFDGYPEVAPPNITAEVRCFSTDIYSKWRTERVQFQPIENSLWLVSSRLWRFYHRGKLRGVPESLGKWLWHVAYRREGYAATYVRAGGYLVLPFGGMIPVPYLRAILLNEGTSAVPEAPRAITAARSRCYSNVSEDVAANICEKLSVHLEIVESRRKESN